MRSSATSAQLRAAPHRQAARLVATIGSCFGRRVQHQMVCAPSARVPDRDEPPLAEHWAHVSGVLLDLPRGHLGCCVIPPDGAHQLRAAQKAPMKAILQDGTAPQMSWSLRTSTSRSSAAAMCYSACRRSTRSSGGSGWPVRRQRTATVYCAPARSAAA
jgi:hypothetical protein